VVVNRDGTDFEPRERALMTALRLHLVNLYRLVSHGRASPHEDTALADEWWSVLVLDDTGTVLESNPVAVAIGAAAGVDLAAGASLRGGSLWHALAARRGDVWSVSRTHGPTRVHSPFEARLMRSPVGPHLLWIRSAAAVTVADVTALGLSPRQAEVALLLRDGLTNDQIARRLGIAPGTVRKHLEGIFTRLGVASRAAAVGRLQARPPRQR
jgi:DNA-binding CsgD family transcriptional regulator